MHVDEQDFDRAHSQPAWRRYLRFIRRDPRADLEDELHDHVESTVEALMARGLDERAARAEAIRRFGDVARVRDEVTRIDARNEAARDRRITLESLVYDLRHALRGLRRNPLFTVVGAVSIALGVAANATVFSVVNAMLLRPIPGTHADGIVRVYRNHHSQLPWRDLEWFRDRASSLAYMFGEQYSAMAFRVGSSDAERIHVSYVTRGFFPGLGARMALGRTFDVPESNTADAAQTVMSYSFWQRRFAGDSSVLGRRVMINDHPVTVVGIAAPDFRSSVMMWTPDLIVPLALEPTISGRPLSETWMGFYVTARLRPGFDASRAESELRGLMARLAKTDSTAYEGMTIRLDHARGVNAELRPVVAAGSGFMMLMVVLVLLVACANVANLLLGRAAARRTEMGVRLAIGASRGRLVRQLLTESFLLALIGSAAGFAAAFWLTRLLPAALPPEAGLDRAYFAPDVRVIAFCGALCLLTTIVFGVAPALHAASPHLVGLLKGDSRSKERRIRRGALVVVQTAMCVVLLAVASLFLRSMARMSAIDPGFKADGIVDVDVDLKLAGQTAAENDALGSVLRQLSALPGVTSASAASVLPLTGSNMETRIAPENMHAASAREYPMTYFNNVGPRYFETLRTPLVRGREFLETDKSGTPRVAVVNEAAVRRWWPKGDAIGKRFHWGDATGPLVEIVGVARNADYVMPGENPKPTVYLPIAQSDRSQATFILRASSDVAATRKAVWEVLHRELPALPPATVTRMVDDMSITLLPVRGGAALLGIFGALALILAACGIYGVASYSVASRSREIGIRAALGATSQRLLSMILVESTKRVAIGAAIGISVTLGIAVVLSKVLYGVQALDPIVLPGVTLLVVFVALLASFGPATRAAGADPVKAIRSE